MKIKNKLDALISLMYYIFGAVCLVLMAKTGMGAVGLVAAAMSTPDHLFTNKVMYANMCGLGIVFALMFISSKAFEYFFNLGLYYWKLAFKSEGEE